MVRGKLIGAAVACLAAFGPGVAQAQDESGVVITDPSWTELPDPHELGEAYPKFASWIDTGGSAQLMCRVTLQGSLALCEVVKTTPEGLGFDRAALSLTPRFRLNPRTVDGDIEKSTVQFAVRFALPPEETIPVWDGEEPSVETVAWVRAGVDRLTERFGPPPHPMLADLDVDEDRRTAVAAMIRTVESGVLDRRLDGVALIMARTSNADQLAAISQGRPPPGPPPPADQARAASSELQTLDREVSGRVRALYCARYSCASSDAFAPGN